MTVHSIHDTIPGGAPLSSMQCKQCDAIGYLRIIHTRRRKRTNDIRRVAVCEMCASKQAIIERRGQFWHEKE